MYIGKNIMELSFEWLNTDTPLITLHKRKEKQFDKLFKRYNFKLEDKKWGYYSLFSTELAYNGCLSSKELSLNKIEIMDLCNITRYFIDNNVYDINLIINNCINLWQQRELLLN